MHHADAKGVTTGGVAYKKIISFFNNFPVFYSDFLL